MACFPQQDGDGGDSPSSVARGGEWVAPPQGGFPTQHTRCVRGEALPGSLGVGDFKLTLVPARTHSVRVFPDALVDPLAGQTTRGSRWVSGVLCSFSGVPGEEGQRLGRRTAVRNEGAQEGDAER